MADKIIMTKSVPAALGAAFVSSLAASSAQHDLPGKGAGFFVRAAFLQPVRLGGLL